MQMAITANDTPSRKNVKHLNFLATDDDDTAEERFEEIFATLELPAGTSPSLFGK